MFRSALVFAFLALLTPAVAVRPAFAQSAPDFAAAQNEAVKFLSDLVKIDTSNPPGNEIRAAEYIKSVLAGEGIVAQIYESAPGRGNLVANCSAIHATGAGGSGGCSRSRVWLVR